MASDINNLTVCGRLVKDSSYKDFNNGSGVLEMSIAVNRSVKKGEKWEDEASFFDVKYISKGASKLSQYCTKGTQIVISGSIVQERWEKDGKKNSAVKIYASNIQLVGGKKETDNSNSTSSKTEYDEGDNFPNDIPF